MKFLGIALLVVLAHLAYAHASNNAVLPNFLKSKLTFYFISVDGDATYYFQGGGITACGEGFNDNDLIGAIAFSWWTEDNPNNDPNCQKSARVTDPSTGKSVTVRIKDKCGGCKRGDIDLSVAAFKSLRPLSVGRFPVRWDFV